MKSRFIHSLIGLFILALPAFAQVPPEKALSTFTVPDGLELSLFASEPLFVNPTCMDVDHKGRVWVCESVNYRNKLRGFKKLTRPEGDRIVILEDTKGTGRANKATTFYQSPELLAPLGIAVAKDPVGPGYKVFVCQSPDILVFEDKDGDGKADGPPKKLLSGFGGYDHDHGVHGILIGPDLKLYFSVGDTGVHGLQSSDGKGRKWQSNSTDCRAGTIWRCDLDGKNLQLIAHNFRNEYEPCVDSFGTVFVSDNDDDGNQQTRICHVMPGGNYGYHPRGPGQTHWHEEQPGVVHKILRTGFGSPTGMCVYEGTLLPKKYQGQLLHTDAGPRHLRCYHLKPNGASYDVDREDMVTSTDNWFRPSDVCVGPDGSVFIADWYDPGVGGHGMGDITRGRIFRLAPKGHKEVVSELNLETKQGFSAALGSPNLATRYMAMAKLDTMEKTKAVKWLEAAAMQSENKYLQARAIWQLARLHRFRQVNTALHSTDKRFRTLALRALKDYQGQSAADLVADWRKLLAEETSPEVRREALLLLRDVDPDKAKSLLYELAKSYDGKDRFYLAAIGIAVGHHDQARRDIILADFEKHFPEWNDKVADLVWELRPPAVMASLGTRLADPKLEAGPRARIVDILAASEDPKAGVALLEVFKANPTAEIRAKVLENLKLFLPGKWSAVRTSKELNDAIAALLAKPEGQSDGLALIAAAEKSESLPELKRLFAAERTPPAIRAAAVQTIATLPSAEAAKFLVEVMNQGPQTLNDEIVRGLGFMAQQKPDRPAVGLAVEALQSVVTKSADVAQRHTAVAALAGTRPGTQWLLALNDKKQLPDDLKSETARLLRNSPYQDLRNKAMVAFPPPGRLDLKKLPSIPALAARRGNAERGRQIMAASVKNDMQCLKCHTVRGLGGNIGPDLSVIGKKASRENLFESILYPSKAIADQYLNWQIENDKGQVLTGLIVEETPDSVTLRDGNGKDTKIAKKDIESRKKGPKSLMPEDLLVYMTEDDLVDSVEYLFTLKTPTLAMDYWHIVGPFDNGANDAGLDEVFPPEKNIDLKEGYKGKNGMVQWRTVRPTVTGYVDLQAHYGPSQSDNIVSYLTRDIESPADQDASILIGVDDACKLFINDKLVHTDRRHIAAAPEADTVKVKLKKGKNRIVLKINNGSVPHGFYFTIVAEQELKRL